MAHDDLTQGRITVPGGTEAVGDLALRVLSALNARQGNEESHPKHYARDLLYKRVTSPFAFDASVVMDEMRAMKISCDSIIDHYIPDSAERIGVDWVDDRLDFAQVTIASMRLQSLLNEAAYSSTAADEIGAHCFDALVVMTEVDQHTLGGFVVAAQLRRKGAGVEIMCAETAASIVDVALTENFDVVIFSCSSIQALASVKEIASKIRSSKIRIPMLALGGLIVTRTHVAATEYCVDLVTNDLTEILSLFEKKSADAPTAKK